MTEGYVETFNPSHYFILELTTHSIELIAQALHLYKANMEYNSDLLEQTFQSLIDQTNVVNRSPNCHGVYIDPLKAPKNAILSKNVFVLPIG